MCDAAGLGFQRAVTNRIGDHVVDLRLIVTHIAQGFGHAAIDDFEVAAARQFLELHQCEIGFDAGCIAIHHQTNCSGRRDDGGLRVAEAKIFAHGKRIVPCALRRFGQIILNNCRQIERHGQGGQRFIAFGFAVCRAAMIAHHFQHGVPVRREFGEGAKLARHLRRCCIGHARHGGADSASDGAPFAAVIGDARSHQQPANIGKAQTQRAVIIGQLRNFLGRELRHRYRNFQHDGPQPHGMFKRGNVEDLLAVRVVA